MSPFHLRLALSGSTLPYLPSWPISQHPHHAHQTPSLSPGITNVVLQQIQVCQCRVVLQTLCQCLTADKDMQNTWWNHLRFIEISRKRNLSAFYRILFILPLIPTYPCGLQWNEMNKLKFTQICMMDLAHLSTNRVIFLSLMSPFHLRLALSGSIFPYLPSWPISQHPHHAHQTPSLSPGITNVVLQQIQVCQGWVVLQTLCQCLTADKDMQNSKYVVKSSKIHWNSRKRNLNAFYRILLILPLILTYHVVSNEMKWTSSNSLRSAWWTWHISAPIV